MSYIATQAHSILNQLFPANPHKRVFEEHYVNYKGQKLFFDFYIKELKTLIEIQGGQHSKFVKHFHSDAEGFRKQKFRDNLKLEYVQENDLCLVRIYDTEKVTEQLMLSKISKAMETGFYE